MPVTGSGESLPSGVATPSVQPDPVAQEPPRLSVWQGVVIISVGIMLWMTSVIWPSTTGTMGNEESWVQVLHYGFANHWQWGSDLIYTYGPLGFLLTYEFVLATFSSFVVWTILGHGVCVAMILYYALRMAYRRGAAILIGLLLVFTCFQFAFGRDNFYLVALWLMCCGYMTSRRMTWWPLLAIFGIGTILSLAKFTFFPIYLGVGGALLAHLWREQGWRRAATALFVAVSVGVGGWLGCGQQLTGLPRHIRSSLEISRGYSIAMMGSFGDQAELIMAGLVILIFVAAWGLRTRDVGNAFSRSLTAGVSGMVAFLVWKHGFVRQDGHSVEFFSVMSCMACGAWMEPARSRAFAQGKSILTVAIIGISLFAAFRRAEMEHTGLTPLNAPLMAADRGITNVRTLVRLPSYAAEQSERRRAVSNSEGIADLRERIGNEPIAWLMNTQAQPLVTGLKLYPRGVIQSYSAYTEWLANEDAKCFQTETGPRFAAVRIDLIDGHFPMGDDGPALLEILNRYKAVGGYGGAVLFERRPASDATAVSEEIVLDQEIQVGQSFSLESLAASWSVASLDVRYSSWGKLVTGLYKSPHVTLHVETTGGGQFDFQLIPEMCRAWFLVDPLVTNGNDFAHLAAGIPEKRVSRIRVDIAEQGRNCFQDSVRIRLRRQPALLPLTGNPLDSLLANGLYTRPVASASPRQGGELLHGRTIYRLAAPGWLKLPLPSTARRIRGLFGQFEMGGDDLAIKQSGVTFVIVHLDEAGRSTSLFQKTLNPWNNPANRGEQKFDLLLPGLRGGSLRLETHAGQSWAEGCYWGEVRWE